MLKLVQNTLSLCHIVNTNGRFVIFDEYPRKTMKTDVPFVPTS